MSKRLAAFGILALAVIAASFLFTRKPGAPEAPGARNGARGQAQPAVAFLESARGEVAVLLLGMEGCPETAKATPLLAAYAQASPDGVAIARIDVPLPGSDARPAPGWPHPYAYLVDKQRQLADRLEFFFYPTLYIVDRDGDVRFAGACDIEKVEAMVSEILAEPAGLTAKKMYTRPLPAVGSQAAAFAAETVDGRPTKLDDLRGEKGTLLFFGSISCPFSVAEVPKLAAIARAFAEKGIAAAIINKPEPAEAVQAFYAEGKASVPVLLDADGTICAAYGVEAVPFCFVLDQDGKVAARHPFTQAAAESALGELLGIALGKAPAGCASTGAG